jgi:hypothetical protein
MEGMRFFGKLPQMVAAAGKVELVLSLGKHGVREKSGGMKKSGVFWH